MQLRICRLGLFDWITRDLLKADLIRGSEVLGQATAAFPCNFPAILRLAKEIGGLNIEAAQPSDWPTTPVDLQVLSSALSSSLHLYLSQMERSPPSASRCLADGLVKNSALCDITEGLLFSPTSILLLELFLSPLRRQKHHSCLC